LLSHFIIKNNCFLEVYWVFGVATSIL